MKTAIYLQNISQCVWLRGRRVRLHITFKIQEPFIAVFQESAQFILKRSRIIMFAARTGIIISSCVGIAHLFSLHYCPIDTGSAALSRRMSADAHRYADQAFALRRLPPAPV